MAACAGAAPTQAWVEPMGQAVQADVVRDGDTWTVAYQLNEDAPVWAFQRSALLRVGRTPWRPAWWTVQTPGVVLERHRALNWLVRFAHADWDDVDMPT